MLGFEKIQTWPCFTLNSCHSLKKKTKSPLKNHLATILFEDKNRGVNWSSIQSNSNTCGDERNLNDIFFSKWLRQQRVREPYAIFELKIEVELWIKYLSNSITCRDVHSRYFKTFKKNNQLNAVWCWGNWSEMHKMNYVRRRST